MTDDIHTFLGAAGDTQICFCADGAPLPPEPLDKHSFGCLTWDWALANQKITAAKRTEQLNQYANSLGLPSGD